MGDIYPALGALIGGGTGALDKMDGAGLADGDAASVILDTGVYHYHLNATSGAAENSPYIIAPDTNPGTKRWILVTPAGAFSHVKANTPTNLQTISTSTDTTLIFDTEEYDTLGEYDHTTGIFTAIYPGKYAVSAQAHMENTAWAAGEQLFLGAIKNTTETIRGPRITAWGTATVRMSCSISGTVHLDAGDTLKIQIYHNEGGDVDVAAGIWANFLTIDRLP